MKAKARGAVDSAENGKEVTVGSKRGEERGTMRILIKEEQSL
jgi:hypothetical protein